MSASEHKNIQIYEQVLNFWENPQQLLDLHFRSNSTKKCPTEKNAPKRAESPKCNRYIGKSKKYVGKMGFLCSRNRALCHEC